MGSLSYKVLHIWSAFPQLQKISLHGLYLMAWLNLISIIHI